MDLNISTALWFAAAEDDKDDCDNNNNKTETPAPAPTTTPRPLDGPRRRRTLGWLRASPQGVGKRRRRRPPARTRFGLRPAVGPQPGPRRSHLGGHVQRSAFALFGSGRGRLGAPGTTAAHGLSSRRGLHPARRTGRQARLALIGGAIGSVVGRPGRQARHSVWQSRGARERQAALRVAAAGHGGSDDDDDSEQQQVQHDAVCCHYFWMICTDIQTHTQIC